MPIKRFFDEEYIPQIERDFGFLFRIIKDYKGELELSFRDNYFSLYYRGNSAAKIQIGNDDTYKILMHKKFCPQSLAADSRFSPIDAEAYISLTMPANLLHPLFQKKYLNEIFSNIKQANYSEELAFEQILITDNHGREDLLIIDRQVTDAKLQRQRIDLLALRQVEENRYSFLVLEVKMGNNPELKSEVAEQVDRYVTHLEKYWSDYRSCYERQYQQKKMFGLISIPQWESINIVQKVQGLIVVGGYSGLAKEQIRDLKMRYPNILVKEFVHRL